METDIYSFFDEGGLLSQAFDGFEFREGQLEMSLLIQKAYEQDSIAVIEAGTGIGKSFAYLVPAIINSRKHEEIEKTIIATSTKNLQMQLSKKDIPQLFKASKDQCTVAMLFGRANYICLRRLDEIVQDMKLLIQDTDSDLGKFLAFTKVTETGLFADYRERLPEEIRTSCLSDSDLCYGRKCPFVRECFYLKAKHEASKADILITNHHLLFTDAADRLNSDRDFIEDGILPPYLRLVIDEAHNIEQNATDLFTSVYSGYDVSKQLSLILRSRYGGRESLLDNLSRFCTDDSLVQAVKDRANSLNEKMATLDLFLTALLRERNSTSLLIQDPKAVSLEEFYPLADAVNKDAALLLDGLRAFSKSLRYSDEDQMTVDELGTMISRLENCFSCLNRFADKEHWTEDVYFIKTEKIKNEMVLEVCISPISIAQKLSEGIFSKLKTVVCTSATLNLNDDFNYWASRVGLPVEGRPMMKLVVLSPFEYKKNLLLLAPSDAPEFKEAASEDFQAYAKDVIYKAILSSNGGALVLFTSYIMMRSVHSILAPLLEKKGYKALIQGSYDRFHLLKDFKEDPDSVLFATNSFWEGVDVPGNALRLVIIVKLPFSAPTEPILKARTKKIEKEGGSGFFNLALPEATMKLKQGFGRLIRNKTDKGIVLILDSRVITKNYGQFMIHALPESYYPETETSGICDKIESFLYN